MRGLGSNGWRIEWSLRTLTSVAAASALALYAPTQRALSNGGAFAIGPPFACFVSIIVKDNTLGGSMANAWGCLYGSSLACLAAYTVQILIGDKYNSAAAVLLLLLFSFALNYVEFHPMGKKLGLSILALNLVAIRPNPADAWLLLANVLAGVLCGLLGNLLPWPRLASVQVGRRSRFIAEALRCLLSDAAVAWRYSSIPLQPQLSTRKATSVSSSADLRALFHYPLSVAVHVDPSPPRKHHAWILLRNMLTAVVAFRGRDTRQRWSTRYAHHTNNLHMRLELATFLEEDLSYMAAMCADARFGPHRARAIVRNHHFCTLTKDLLLLVHTLERRLRDIRNHPSHHAVLHAFQDRPSFRLAVDRFVQCVGAAVVAAAAWLSDPSASLPGHTLDVLRSLRLARDALDEAYIRARVDIYYNEDPSLTHAMTSFVAMSQNSFMMLFDALFFVVGKYFDVFLKSDGEAGLALSAHLAAMGSSIQRDLFPPQRHLFALKEGAPGPAMRTRALQSASLSLSMAVAALYGLYVEREQASLAAFTIAYLSGGVVTGANAITSLNRASGTVAGSVYALVVSYIIARWSVVSARVFIFFALLLFQLPCTYIRTLPIYGYTGTVAAFTAAVLILLPAVTEHEVVQRIIDTYVGVVIFLAADVLISPSYSDDALLSDVDSVFRSIRDHFKRFAVMFNQQAAEHNRSTLIADIVRGKDVRLFASSIPMPWRPPPLESRIIDELIAGSEAAHRSIQGMMWALVVCRRDADLAELTYQLSPLRGQLDAQLSSVAAFIESVASFLQDTVQHMRSWRALEMQAKHCSLESLVSGAYVAWAGSALSNRLALVSSGEEEAPEVRNFFLHIEDMIMQLQEAYREQSREQSDVSSNHLGRDEAEEPDQRLARVLAVVISNEEVKGVNGVLACTRDLVEAIRTISSAMTRLRAYRDIRITQSGAAR